MVRKMDKRVPVSAKTQARLRIFRKAAGLTYDAAINMLLDHAVQDSTESVAGAKMRYGLEIGEANYPNVELGNPEEEDDSIRLLTPA